MGADVNDPVHVQVEVVKLWDLSVTERLNIVHQGLKEVCPLKEIEACLLTVVRSNRAAMEITLKMAAAIHRARANQTKKKQAKKCMSVVITWLNA